MKFWTISCAVAALVAGAGAARADQCQLVDGDTALRAMQLLRDHPNVVTYCEPCNDRAPSDATAARWVHTERGRAGAYELVIDRREVDLAYTYVQTGPRHFENLALLAGCPASGVSAALAIDAPPSPAPAAREPDAPLTYTTYVVTEHRSVSFATVLGTCLATSAACTFGWFFALRRRRLAMRPRAVRLLDRGAG